MRIIGAICFVFSLILAACGSENEEAKPAATRLPPPSITAATANQIALRQTFNEEGLLYYNPLLHPGGEAALYEVMDNAEFVPRITVFDTFTGQQLLTLTTKTLSEPWDDKFVASVDYSPDGATILVSIGDSQSSMGELVVFDSTSGEELHRWPVDNLNSGGAAHGLNGEVVVVSSYDFEPGDASLVLLDAASGELLGTLELDAPVQWMAVSGNTIAYNTYKGDTVVSFELGETGETGVSFDRPLYTSETQGFGYYVFSPDGSLFTTYDRANRIVQLHSTVDGTLHATVQVPGDAEDRIFDAYTDGELLVLAEENQVRIFDLEGNLLAEREHLASAGLCRMDTRRITLVCNSEGGVSIWGIVTTE